MKWLLNNYADRGGCYNHTKAEYNNCCVFIQSNSLFTDKYTYPNRR